MLRQMVFQREKQNVSAGQLLQAFVDGDEIQLSKCTITGALDVNRLFDPAEKFQIEKLDSKQDGERRILTLPESVVFDKCIFEEDVVFTGPWDKSESVTVRFKSDIIFSISTFKAQARFRDAKFDGIASFDGCVFSGVNTFRNAIFENEARFRTVSFNGYGLFGNAVFKDSARFTNSHFAKGVNFSGSRFQSFTDFGGVYSSSRAVPSCDSTYFGRRRYGDDESFWRFVKQSAQEAGHYQLAGEYFYKERCARLWQKVRGTGYSDTLPAGNKLMRMIYAIRLLPELVFGKLLFGYGERPVRVLIAGALIIIACAFFYAQPDLLVYRGQSTEPSFSQGLYFSTITFTTLGYGDLHPAVNGVCRYVAMVEAMAGGCMMALFVVCLAKRFSRG